MMDDTIERRITARESIELLNSSGLGERRPVGSPEAIALMLEHSNLLATAWDGPQLAGAARCFTDFVFVTYCSDLAVRAESQRRSIGKVLPRNVLRAAPCRIVLLGVLKTEDDYPRIGFTQSPLAWTFLRGELA